MVTPKPRNVAPLNLVIEEVPSDQGDDWDAFVRGSEDWTPYHLYGWRRVIEGVHGHECVYLGARRPNGTLAGVLPMVRIRSRLFGHYLVSMPFLNYGGPLGEAGAIRSLVAEAGRRAADASADLLELRSAKELPLELPVSHRKITVLLDLPPGDADPLWNALKGKVRSQVRRPMKEGVEVRFGPEQVTGFYRVFSQHMRDLGTPVQPRTLFEAALEQFGSTMWLGCAYLGREPVAAGCGFRWADRFELVWASSLREHNRIAPNMLLYWRFMERCTEDGAEIFDFGRCTPGSGTHRFKGQWGGRDEQLWWYQAGKKAGGGTPSPDSGLYSLASQAWSRMPLSVANVLGPRIVRSIP